MYAPGPKSPALETGSVTQIYRRPETSWFSSHARRRFGAVALLALSLTLVGVRYLRLPAGLYLKMALYRVTTGFNPLDSAILDMTKSRKHKAMLRPSITYELHTLESSGVFADWFGNPIEVGPSPFDYAIPPEWQDALPGRRSWIIQTDSRKQCPNGVSSNADTHLVLACGPEVDDELCDLASSLASSKYRQIELAEAGFKADVVLTRTTSQSAKTAEKVKLRIDVLDECVGYNCTSHLDLAHGGVSLERRNIINLAVTSLK